MTDTNSDEFSSHATSSSSSIGKKRASLTIREKYDLIELHEKQKVKPKELMKIFACGKTQLYQILRDRDKFKKYISEAKLNVNRKKVRTGKNEVVNIMVYDWYKTKESEYTREGKFVTGNMIQNKAMEFVKILGIEGFKASNGWLNAFVNRHGIQLGQKVMGSNDVELESIPHTTLEAIDNQNDSVSDDSECDVKDPLLFMSINTELENNVKMDVSDNMTMTDAANNLKKIKVMLDSKGKLEIAKKLQEVCDEIENEITFTAALKDLDKIHKMLVSTGKKKIADKIEEIHNEINELNNE